MNLNALIHLTSIQITEVHDTILERSFGLKKTKPGYSVDALVGRIQSNLTYQSFSSIEEVAALYAEVICRGHVFNDGNKRTALLSMLIFLELNGYSIACNEDAVADQIVFLADGKSDFKRFSVWLKGKVTPF